MQFTTAIGQRYGDTTVNQPAIAGAPKYLGLSNAFGRTPTTCGGRAYLSGRAAVSLQAASGAPSNGAVRLGTPLETIQKRWWPIRGGGGDVPIGARRRVG